MSTLVEENVKPIGPLVAAEGFDVSLIEDAAPKFLSLAQAILDNAASPRSLHNEIDKAVFDYFPMKLTLVQYLSKSTEPIDPEQFAIELNRGLLDILSKTGQQLSQHDSEILLDVFRMQTRLATLISNVPPNNRRALDSALEECFWELLKVDLAMSIIILTKLSLVDIHSAKKLHWLCLAIAKYQRRIESCFFAYNPVLRERMKTPGKLLTTEEMERLLGSTEQLANMI